MTFAEKIKNFFSFSRDAASEESLEELEDLLVEGDFGPAESYNIVEQLEKRVKKDKMPPKEALAAVLLETLLTVKKAPPLPPPESGILTVLLLLGVNGVGKTTTTAKLCARYAAYRPVLAAADTFRAGAIEQLTIHGERLGARVIAHKAGSDPAAVVFDAVNAARASGSGMVIADTAGRMHTKKFLVDELKKINRAAESADNSKGGLFCQKYLVLDATTGRNAVSQAEVFHEAVALDGVILTKTDSEAKGGIVWTLAQKFALPVVFLCRGENYGDIVDFDGEAFVKKFLGGAE